MRSERAVSNNDNVVRLTKDLVAAAKLLTDAEARYLVDYYYIAQGDRKRANNQVRSMGEAAEPTSMVSWLAQQSDVLESQIRRALVAYTDAHPVGAWLKSIVGIGPVIASGLLAHIDIERAQTAGAIWRLAGLDPTQKWEKGQKRPWNAALKTLTWHAGESFVKTSGKEDAFYGKYYAKRKEYRVAKNIAGDYAEHAAKIVKECPTHAQAATYKEGRLPDGHIHAQAKRDAVKLFLSHLHGYWYELHYGKKPPLPYPIQFLGHVHYIAYPGEVE